MYGAAQLAVGAGAFIANDHGVLSFVLFLTICFLAFAILSLHVRKKII
jgi:hypothetical protein